jgi:uncharacterized membrane protein
MARYFNYFDSFNLYVILVLPQLFSSTIRKPVRFGRIINSLNNSLKNLDVHYRLLLSVVVAGIVFTLLPSSMLIATRALVTWDFGVIFHLGLLAIVVGNTTPNQMRSRVQNQDEKPTLISFLVIAATSASLFAIGFILGNTKGMSKAIVSLHVGLSVVAIIGSWLLTHTAFALHYAHNYYSAAKNEDDEDNTEQSCEAGGLNFPGEDLPDYWDFLYFSLVIGMTSQVSDVEISSRDLRRMALVHGVLSFFFNTAILALSLNIIAGLI